MSVYMPWTVWLEAPVRVLLKVGALLSLRVASRVPLASNSPRKISRVRAVVSAGAVNWKPRPGPLKLLM